MLKVFACSCVLQVAVCIIVTDSPPPRLEYTYSYEIVDPTTGDSKSLQEVKHDGVVSGSYSVVDPDGTKRIVDYTADARTGFKAVIRSEPLVAPFSFYQRHGVPYSSLYHSQNLNNNQLKNIAPAYFVEPLKRQDIFFRPGRGPPTKEKFEPDEFFKPNRQYK